MWVRLPNKSKPYNYSKTKGVNVADRWRGRLRSYLGRP
ncbi:arginase [Lachnotalea glycerini]|uniref:Arginase n=1 Tax=Lachnotalea glycerini TaxID=1763509 RepID=A0A371J5A3_9FIRM|nr:arginase [Lachnotalea glycerini]